MRNHLNGTGRRRITRNHAQVSLRAAEEAEAQVFDLSLDLSSYEFPPDARVRIEAWRSNAVQRWDCGTVGALAALPDEERRLTEVPESAQFRVIVVAGDGSGLLLGHAPNIRPVLPRRSLLPVRETDELDDEVWRVDFGSDGMDPPQLLINPAVDGISEIVRGDGSFRSLVMPEVLRTILAHIVLVQREDPDDSEGWWEGWFAIARALVPYGEPPRLHTNAGTTEIAEASEWIDRVVAAFADERVDAAETYNTALHGQRS